MKEHVNYNLDTQKSHKRTHEEHQKQKENYFRNKYFMRKHTKQIQQRLLQNKEKDKKKLRNNLNIGRETKDLKMANAEDWQRRPNIQVIGILNK